MEYGFLGGRLRGYEREEDLIKLVKSAKRKIFKRKARVDRFVQLRV